MLLLIFFLYPHGLPVYPTGTGMGTSLFYPSEMGTGMGKRYTRRRRRQVLPYSYLYLVDNIPNNVCFKLVVKKIKLAIYMRMTKNPY